MFADMVGFTAISEHLGEEGTYALIQPIYDLMANAVSEQGGSVKDFTGDGIMALFGAPVALEDGPLRACRTALLIHERLADRMPAIEASHGVRPLMRVGINTGLAVVTQVRTESTSATALGDTVNLASRLQSIAEPGTTVLSEATHRLVQGLVETSFVGVYEIKGKTEPQKIYRLDGLRHGATRFTAALGRGLSTYVGREQELEVLERCLREAQTRRQVIDVEAEPGMGKSRLLHEFKQRIDPARVSLLQGSCSSDGQQTPLLPFIEVVRSSFQVRFGEAQSEVARKLELGLATLGLLSSINAGLLLNLLGLQPAEGALAGLDGVLIGLRTRELLSRLLEARCRLSPVVLVFEDLHWMDSISEDLIGEMIGASKDLPLLVLSTRRPEYIPPWLTRTDVVKLRLQSLSADDIRRLFESRLKVKALPDGLARQLTARVEGNALFAEELVSYLIERGMLRHRDGTVEFDGGAVAAALPSSVQSLLTARVDRLSQEDRALLQAAAVIGRRFDAQLLAAVTEARSDLDAHLTAMQRLDLVYHEEKSGDYVFKHALVRDALYQSLLSGPRAALHQKIASEIERRSDNRLAEVVDILAHHYGQTDRFDKAFVYLGMAGAKSSSVYSFDEADAYFTAAVALLDNHPDCASDQQVADVLADYCGHMQLTLQLKPWAATTERFALRLDRLGDNLQRTIILHDYVLCLLWSGRYKEATAAQCELSAMAERLGIATAKAYALTSAIHESTITGSIPIDQFDAVCREALEAAAQADDARLECFLRFVIGWQELILGRPLRAHAAADELMGIGRAKSDPRSIGFATYLKAWTAAVCYDAEAALSYADQSLRLARAPFERVGANNAKTIALTMLKRPEALPAWQSMRKRYLADGFHWHLVACDGFIGVALVISGRYREGIRQLETTINRIEREGYIPAANWHRLTLSEVYLQMIAGTEKPPAAVILRNLPTLTVAMLRGPRRIIALIEAVDLSWHDPNGQHIGRKEMILGLLHKAKKRRTLAVRHLSEARRITALHGSSPMLTRIEAALSELT